MALLRVERVIQALTDNEVDTVTRVVKNYGRRELQTLWHILLEFKKEKKFAEEYKIEIFAAVYLREYSEIEDYLLRNEYRILLSKVYEVIAEKALLERNKHDSLFHDFTLATQLYERGLWSEFTVIAERGLATSLRLFDYQMQLELQEMIVKSIVFQGTISHDRLKEVVTFVNKRIETLKEYFYMESQRMIALRAASEHTLLLMGLSYTQSSVEIDLDFSASTSMLSEYYYYKTLSVQLQGDRVEAAKKALEIILPISDDSAAIRREKLIAMATYGTMLTHVGHRYAEASTVFKNALDYCNQHKIQQLDSQLIFNYVSTLIKSNDFDTALDYIENNKQRTLDSPTIGFRYGLMKTVCYIFKRDWKAATDALPPHMNRFPENEYHYAWFLVTILSYLRGDAEDALRETMNFAKRFSRKNMNILKPDDQELVNAFRSFYQGVISVDIKRRQRFFTDANEHILLSIQHDPLKEKFLPTVWLKNELESFKK